MLDNMKILIVAGNNVVFRSLAQRLRRAIGGAHSVDLATELTRQSPWAVFRDRVRRQGFIKGLDQFLFKLFDMQFLRRHEELSAQRLLDRSLPVLSIHGLNSTEGIAFLRAGAYDVVICLATSIVGKEALAVPSRGFVNVHPGVLPAYRGTGNFWAVINEDWKRLGCTVHWMTEKIDAGAIITITHLRCPPSSLWALHVAAMKQGVDELGALLRKEVLLETVVNITGQITRYYGWYGFIDYWRFKRALARKLN